MNVYLQSQPPSWFLSQANHPLLHITQPQTHLQLWEQLTFRCQILKLGVGYFMWWWEQEVGLLLYCHSACSVFVPYLFADEIELKVNIERFVSFLEHLIVWHV